MSGSTDASNQVQQLRDKAAVRLEDAAQSGDPARRDTLIMEALAMLAEARELQAKAEYPAEERSNTDPLTGSTSARTH